MEQLEGAIRTSDCPNIEPMTSNLRTWVEQIHNQSFFTCVLTFKNFSQVVDRILVILVEILDHLVTCVEETVIKLDKNRTSGTFFAPKLLRIFGFG